MKKTENEKTFLDLAKMFCEDMSRMGLKSKIAVIAFDTYHQQSLKNATRKLRLGNANATQYSVNDTSNIEKVTLKELLSHVGTKKDLTMNLMEKLQE